MEVKEEVAKIFEGQVLPHLPEGNDIVKPSHLLTVALIGLNVLLLPSLVILDVIIVLPQYPLSHLEFVCNHLGVLLCLLGFV